MTQFLLDVDRVSGTAVLEGTVEVFRAKDLATEIIDIDRILLLNNFNWQQPVGKLVEYQYEQGRVTTLYAKFFVPDYELVATQGFLAGAGEFDLDGNVKLYAVGLTTIPLSDMLNL